MGIALDSSAASTFLLSGVSSKACTLSTNGTNRIVLAFVSASHTTGTPTITSVAGGSLTWTRRSTQTFIGNSSHNAVQEVWWALAPTALSSATITATGGGTYDHIEICCAAFSGVNTTSPFDPNGALPAAFKYESATNQLLETSGHHPTWTTTDTNVALFSFLYTNASPVGRTNTPVGWNEILLKNNTAGTDWNRVIQAYRFKQDPVTTYDIGAFRDSINRYGIIADALVAADSSAPFFQDGHAKGTSTTSTSVSASLTTDFDGDVIVAVVQAKTSATNRAYPAVTLSDTGGLVTAWKLQYEFSIQNDHSVQVWWGIATTKMSANSITATFVETLAAASLIVFGVAGANTLAPFDNNSSIFPGSFKWGQNFGATAAPTAFSTSSANSMVVVLWGTQSAEAPASPPAGYSTIEVTGANPNIGCMYQIFTSAQTSIAPSMGTIANNSIGVIAFAIAKAGETNVTAKPPTPMISAVNNAENVVSSSSITCDITTPLHEGLIFALVARNSNQAVTMSDSGSHISGWTKYATINESTDIYVDIWYGQANAALSADTITATFAAAVVKKSIIVFHATHVESTTPFDSNVSFPATNQGTAFAAMTTGAGSTGNTFVAVLGITGQAVAASPLSTTTLGTDPFMVAGGADAGGVVTLSLTWAAGLLSSKTYSLGNNGSGDWVSTWLALKPKTSPDVVNIASSLTGAGILDVVLLHDLELAVDYTGGGTLAVDLTAVDPSVARVTQAFVEVLRSELNVEDIVDTARVSQFYVEILRSNRGTPRAPNPRKRVILASGVQDA